MINASNFEIYRRVVVAGLVGVVALLVVNQAGFGQEAAAEKTTFDDHVKSIFAQRCSACHNPNKKSSDLDVTNFTNLMQGGGSGAAIEPGDSTSSRLYDLITHEDEPAMPPEGKIPDAEIALIKKWIDGGALENKGSVAVKKKNTGVAMVANPLVRPEVVAMPPRLSLQPNQHTAQKGVVRSIATSPWAPLAAVASAQQVLIYNTQTLELLGVLPFPEGAVNVLRFSRSGQVLLAAGGVHGGSGKVVLWDVATGERIAEIGDELDAVLAADISSDHTQVALGGSSKTIKVYSTDTGELQFEMTKPTEWVTSIEFSPDGVLLATGDRNGGLFVWEAMTGREYLTLNGHTASVTGLSWRSDSNVLASASTDTTIRLWEMENGRMVKSWGSHGGGATAIEFTRDAHILSTGRDRITKLWDQAGKQVRAFPALGEIGLSASWCDETQRVISGDFAGVIPVWNGTDGVAVGEISQNPDKLETRLAQASQLVAAATAESTALTKTYTDANAAAAKIQSELDAATATLTETQTKLAATQASQTAIQQEIAKLTEQQKSVSARVAQLDAGVPLLKNTADQATQAAAALGADPELTQSAQKLTELLAARTAEQAAGKQTMTSVAEQLTANNQKLAAAATEITALTAQIQTAQALVNTLTPTLKPAQDLAASSKVAADAGAEKLLAAQAQVNKWNDAIAFTATYEALKQKLGKANEEIVAKESEYPAIVAAVTQVQSELEAKKSAHASAAELVAQRNQELEQKQAELLASQNAETLTTQKMAQQQSTIDGLNTLLPPLKEAVEKFESVAAIASADKQIAEEAVRVKGLLEKNTNDLNATIQALEQSKTELAAQQAKVVEVQQLIAKANEDLGAATGAMQTAQKEMEDVTGLLTKNQQRVADAMKSIEAMKQSVLGIKNEIAAAKGLPQDAL